MKLRQAIKQIESRHENVIIGQGDLRDKDLIQHVEAFIQRFPFLENDLAYCEYLKEISALSYFYSETGEDFTLFGFDVSNGLLFEGGEYNEALIDEDNFFLFGYLIKPNENLCCNFYWDASGKRKKGIYMKKISLNPRTESPCQLYCGSFLELLDRVGRNEL